MRDRLLAAVRTDPDPLTRRWLLALLREQPEQPARPAKTPRRTRKAAKQS